MNMKTVGHVCAWSDHVQLVTGSEDVQFVSVSYDSREVSKGTFFIAIPGQKVDGNDYVFQAMDSDASIVMMSREPSEAEKEAAQSHGCVLLYTDDVQASLYDMASGYRNLLDPLVVGITGSSGKTSTKEMCKSVIGAAYTVWATEGNHNNELGVPYTILNAPEDTLVLILEMGMNSQGEIERLSQCARPHFAIITNIGTSHIGMLGSQAAIAQAKAEIIHGMSSEVPAWLDARESSSAVHQLEQRPQIPCLITYAHDRYAQKLVEYAHEHGVNHLLYGRTPQAAVSLDPYDMVHLAEFLCNEQFESEALLTLAYHGEHMKNNALAAIAAGACLGVPVEVACNFLSLLQPLPMRQEEHELESGACIISDCYNANPDSMCAALSLLGSLQTPGRRIAILGDMHELGDHTQKLHTQVGRFIVDKTLADIVVTVGDKARFIAEAAREAKAEIQRAHQAQEAAQAHARAQAEAFASQVDLDEAISQEARKEWESFVPHHSGSGCSGCPSAHAGEDGQEVPGASCASSCPSTGIDLEEEARKAELARALAEAHNEVREIHDCATHEEVIELVKSMDLVDGDVVLVKASRSAGLEAIVKGLL